MGVEALRVLHFEVAAQQAAAFDEEVHELVVGDELGKLIIRGAHPGPGWLELLDRCGIGALFSGETMHVFEHRMHQCSFDLSQCFRFREAVDGPEAVEEGALLVVGSSGGRQGKWSRSAHDASHPSRGTVVGMNQTSDFLDFIASSPSSFHAAEEVARRLEEAGFHRQDEQEAWNAEAGGHVLVRGGAVMAWWVPEGAGPQAGFRIIGSHTDSPGFTLKPRPEIGASGWQQAGVEVYGGPILASWLDRELSFAGQIVLADGSQRLVNTGPIARIPHLAIHLDRSSELKLDRQQHMQPVVSTTGATVLDAVAEAAGVDKHDIYAHALITVDTQKGDVFGADMELIAAGRMDNLSSVHASLVAFQRAIASGDAGDDVLVLAAFDHEEIGSASTTGAAGPILEQVLSRTADALGATADEFQRMLRRSFCVSADAAHSVHPNYVGKHDPAHQPIIGKGPVTKINANQRYASTAVTVARWEHACRSARVPSQVFVGNNDVPCGSTIGPITATRLGIPTVDVGVPLLSMHSARELAGVRDQLWFADALEAYLINH